MSDHASTSSNSAAGAGRVVTNTKTLSGGERSFTTLSLLLALGNVSDVPFAIFDEIDVFMDEVNRKVRASRRGALAGGDAMLTPGPFCVRAQVTLKALVEVAKEKQDTRQYCILTPRESKTLCLPVLSCLLLGSLYFCFADNLSTVKKEDGVQILKVRPDWRCCCHVSCAAEVTIGICAVIRRCPNRSG